MAIKLASHPECTACLACLDSCTNGAIFYFRADDGHLYPKLNDSLCSKCGKCIAVCPVLSNYEYQDMNRDSQPYAVWANDQSIRMRAASGGLFGALAEYVLRNGGVVAGASMEGLEVKHILIDNVADLSKLQNSKYQQVNSSGIYKSIEIKLREGITVLFGGTSCQVAGLYCFLGKKQYDGRLYTLDMICSGFPTYLSVEAFIKHEKSAIETFIYRDKKDGCEVGHRLSVVYLNPDEHGQKVKTYNKDLIYPVFGTHYTHRGSCLNCRFAYAKRKADITMGDFWGDTDFKEQHHAGISLAIVHTSEGLELMNRSDLTMHRSTWEKILKVNYRMVHGEFGFLKYHPARICYIWLFNHCSYDTLLKVFRGSERYSLLWYPYLFFSKFIGYLERRKRGRVVKNIIKNM